MSAAAATPRPRERIARARLPVSQLLGTALQGPLTRRLRAALLALGIAVGSVRWSPSSASLPRPRQTCWRRSTRSGNNLLTVTPGQTSRRDEVLPDTSVPMIGHMQQVQSAVAVYQVAGANVYRSPLVSQSESGGIGVDAAADNLPAVLGTC